MEPVPATSITGLKITPDVDNSLVSVQVSLSGSTQVNKRIYIFKDYGVKLVKKNCKFYLPFS